MKSIENLKAKAGILKKETAVIYYAYQNPGTGILPKIIIVFVLCYALSPIDLIPDFIPVIGYLDDLIIIPALIALSIKLIPAKIMNDARIRAQENPDILKKNWLFGSIFILIWIIVLTAIILSIVRLFKK